VFFFSGYSVESLVRQRCSGTRFRPIEFSQSTQAEVIR